MLTLKLIRDGAITILETPSVKVVPKDGGGKRVLAQAIDSMAEDEYVVGEGEYDTAYVENARGSTVQTVKP